MGHTQKSKQISGSVGIANLASREALRYTLVEVFLALNRAEAKPDHYSVDLGQIIMLLRELRIQTLP